MSLKCANSHVWPYSSEHRLFTLSLYYLICDAIQETGLWSKLMKEKLVVSEPRSGEKRDFEDVISQFYAVINEISPDQLQKSG